MGEFTAQARASAYRRSSSVANKVLRPILRGVSRLALISRNTVARLMLNMRAASAMGINRRAAGASGTAKLMGNYPRDN